MATRKERKSVPLDDQELALLIKAAKHAHISVASYMRQKALDAAVRDLNEPSARWTETATPPKRPRLL